MTSYSMLTLRVLRERVSVVANGSSELVSGWPPMADLNIADLSQTPLCLRTRKWCCQRLVTVYQRRALAANAECIPQQHPSHHPVGTEAPLAPLFEFLLHYQRIQ